MTPVGGSRCIDHSCRPSGVAVAAVHGHRSRSSARRVEDRPWAFLADGSLLRPRRSAPHAHTPQQAARRSPSTPIALAHRTVWSHRTTWDHVWHGRAPSDPTTPRQELADARAQAIYRCSAASVSSRVLAWWLCNVAAQPAGGLAGSLNGRIGLAERRGDTRRLLLLVAFALMLVGVTGTAAAGSGSDSSGTHSYTSTCEAGLPRFTNTSDPTSTGNGVIQFRATGATLTLKPGESGVLDPGAVSPNTAWDVVFFDLGEPYVFDGGTFGACEQTAPTTVQLTYSLEVAEGCTTGEPMVNFTNTGTGPIHVTIDTFEQQVSPGAAVAVSWPSVGGGTSSRNPSGTPTNSPTRWETSDRSSPQERCSSPTPAVRRPARSTVPPRSSGTSLQRLRRRRVRAASCSSERQAAKSSGKSKPMYTWWPPTGARATSSCCSPVEGRGDGLQMAARSRFSAATTGWLPTSSMSSLAMFEGWRRRIRPWSCTVTSAGLLTASAWSARATGWMIRAATASTQCAPPMVAA